MAEMQGSIAVIATDSNICDSFRFLLETHGYRVETYKSDESFPAGALSTLTCIVVDHSPPELNGLDVIEHIRNRGEITPTVLIAGPSSTHDSERAAKLTALTVLEKPLVADALLSYLCSISTPPRE